VEVHAASTLSAARAALLTSRYDCILVTMELPDGSGLDLVRDMLEPDCAYGTACILVTNVDDEVTATAALKAGAQDHLVKGDLNERSLARAVHYAVERWRLREELAATRKKLVASIEQLEDANSALSALARVDPLTGLANRRAFDESMDRLVAEAGRGRRFALILLDLDNFKRFNDTHGHDVGDELLRSFGVVMREAGRSVDTAARYGGEEFALLLVDVSPVEAYEVADRLRRTMTEQLSDFGEVTASFGVGLFDPRRMKASTLVRKVDEALYTAKSLGRNRVMEIARKGRRSECGPGPATQSRLQPISVDIIREPALPIGNLPWSVGDLAS
jgi:diguanylate cyclase (GGDEF)-like protein